MRMPDGPGAHGLRPDGPARRPGLGGNQPDLTRLPIGFPRTPHKTIPPAHILSAARKERRDGHAVQNGRAAVQGGHQYLRRLPDRIRGGCGGAAAGGAGGRAGGAGALPVLRAVRTGRGILHPLGVHQADRGRHHSRRQARSAQAALQAPPAQRGFLSRAAENRTVK